MPRGHLWNLRARAAGRAGRGVHAGLGGARRALDVPARATLGTHVSGAPRRAAAPADAQHAMHGRTRTVGGQGVMVRGAAIVAILDGNPEAETERNSQKATPQLRLVAKLRAVGGLKTNSLLCGLASPQTLACVQSTRLDTPGQRTEAAPAADARVGVRS